MKTCTRCKETKNITEFVLDKNTQTGLRAQCKECDKIWRLSGKRNLAKYLDERCGSRCQLCNVQYPSEILAFHHTDPSNKKFSPSVYSWRGSKVRQKTIDEAEKCAVLCHNCHALEHKALREGYSLLQKDCNQLELAV